MSKQQTAPSAASGGPNADSSIQVEVVYAREAGQTLLAVKSAPGLTAQEAIDRSGILKVRPEIDLKTNKVGVFGKAIKLDQVLADGDRVEIYTPLIADPKQAKKKQAANRNQAA